MAVPTGVANWGGTVISHQRIDCVGSNSGNGGQTIDAQGFQCGTSTGNYNVGSFACDAPIHQNGFWENCSLTGLSPNTTYYFRPYAHNASGYGIGSESNAKTGYAASTCTTDAAGYNNPVSGYIYGTPTYAGGGSITDEGYVYSSSESNPLFSNSSHVSRGAGTVGVQHSFSLSLAAGTQYYVRWYTLNESSGTPAYGAVYGFVTPNYAAPSVSTEAATLIRATTARLNGTVSSDNYDGITERGFCIGTSSNPTTSGTKHTVSGTTGAMTYDKTGLTPGTTYHVRAYAINGQGTSYGADQSFTPDYQLATVTTSAPSNILTTTATGNGNVTDDGDATITERGVCWATSSNPTTSDNKATSAGTTGAYTPSMTGMTKGTVYHVRAYAINSKGTAYGSDVQFQTDAGVPPRIVVQGVMSFEDGTSDQSAEGFSLPLTYGEPLTPGDPVYFKSDQKVWKADADGSGTYPCVGLALETASSGIHEVLLFGPYRDDSRFNWTVGGLIYLSTSAGLTQTKPTATDNVTQVIGYATHADRMIVDPELVMGTRT